MDSRELKDIVEAVVSEVSGAASVTLEQARELSRRVMEQAAKLGVRAVVAVTDSGANPVLVECSDGAYIASYDIALNKAYTSVALKMTTAELKDLAQPGAPLYGIQFTNGGRIVIFGGGVPIIKNGRIIGGLGVSGGSEEQDTALGAFGYDIVPEIV